MVFFHSLSVQNENFRNFPFSSDKIPWFQNPTKCQVPKLNQALNWAIEQIWMNASAPVTFLIYQQNIHKVSHRMTQGSTFLCVCFFFSFNLANAITIVWSLYLEMSRVCVKHFERFKQISFTWIIWKTFYWLIRLNRCLLGPSDSGR